MIKKIREFYGIPQSLPADYSGIARSYLSMAEIGKRNVDSSKLLTLLKLCNSTKAKTASKKLRSIEKLAKIQKTNFENLIKHEVLKCKHRIGFCARLSQQQF
jgi:transcriptional regulator with XRE-family HTH domain